MKSHFGSLDEKALQQLRAAYNQNANSFSESCEELYDFKTCQRDNGSIYGIPDKSSCQTGKEVSAGQGDNAITNMRMATGRDPRKLDVDVMQSLGPEALVKIYADNHIGGGGKKQDVLAQKAKARLLGIREGEIDINPDMGGIMGGLGKKFAENLANSVFVGETTQAQDKSGTGILAYMIEDDLKNQIEKTGLSFSIEEIEDGIEGVQQLLSNPEDRDIVVKQLERFGIGGLDGLDGDVFSAGKIAALVGGMTKEKGMTAQEMMVHGQEVLVNALKDATRGADTTSLTDATPEQIQKGVDTIKSAIQEEDLGLGREAEAAQEEERRKRLEEKLALIKEYEIEDAKIEAEAAASAEPPGMSKYGGFASFIPKGRPAENIGLELNDKGNSAGYYTGKWQDGYKADYQFGPNGDARIISYLSSGKDVTAAKWESADGHTIITSKKGSKTIIPEFYPVRATRKLMTPTPAKK